MAPIRGGRGVHHPNTVMALFPTGRLENLIERLRWAQERLPVGQLLGVQGIALVGAGFLWGTYTFVMSYPFLLLIGAGLVCLLLAAAAQPGGLLSFMPQGIQDFLLHGTAFDLLYDDSATQNFVRRWGRLLVLCSLPNPTPAQVRALTDGLDQTFLDGVFRQTFLHKLPMALRTLLLPTQRRRLSWFPGSPEARVQMAFSSGIHSVGLPANLGGGSLTSQAISDFLQAKAEAREQAITEPELAPAIVSVLSLYSVGPQFFSILSGVVRQVKQMCFATSICCFTSAALLHLPFARNAILRALTLGVAPPWKGKVTTAGMMYTGRMAALMGLLSIGGAGMVMAISRKANQYWREVEPKSPTVANPHSEALKSRRGAADTQDDDQHEVGSDDSTTDTPVWPDGLRRRGGI